MRGLGSWLRETYPAGVRASVPLRSIDAVHVDANSAVHAAGRSLPANRSADVLRRVSGCIARVARKHAGAAPIHAHMDGPAPALKVAEQRARRTRMAAEAARRGTWQAQQCTPGCFFARRSESAIASVRGVACSGPGAPGEGEAKIFRAIRGSPENSSATVYGGDGDLALLALGHSARSRLYVAAPPWDSGPPGVLDAGALGDAILSGTGLGREALFDLVAAAAFSGNDVLPPVQWATYRTTWPIVLRDRIRIVAHSRISPAGVAKLAIALVKACPYIAPDAIRNPSSVLPYLARLDWSLRTSLGWRSLPERGNDGETTLRMPSDKMAAAQNGLPHGTGNMNPRSTLPRPIAVPLPPEMSNALVAPSLHDLAEMDVDRLTEQLPALSDAHDSIPAMLPGTAAVLVLDGHADAGAAGYLPAALRPLAKAVWSAQRADHLAGVVSDILRVNLALRSLSQKTMSSEDASVIYGDSRASPTIDNSY